MTRWRRWVQSLSWPALAAVILAIAAALFVINAAWWWVAHQLSWWVFALVFALGSLAWQTVKSTVSVIRERRGKARRECQAAAQVPLYAPGTTK